MDSAPNHGENPTKHQHRPPQSTSELLSSAKLVAGAAQSTFARKSDDVDKGKVAGATADLLCAASHYGKLEEKGLGKYVDKAEDYLHQYHTSHSSPAGTHGAGPGHAAAPEAHPPSHAAEGGNSGGGGYGDYIKKAQGFMNNQGHSNAPSHGSESGESGGSGYGDYLKMAQGFLKK